jgi:hypothetical protein
MSDEPANRPSNSGDMRADSLDCGIIELEGTLNPICRPMDEKTIKYLVDLGIIPPRPLPPNNPPPPSEPPTA